MKRMTLLLGGDFARPMGDYARVDEVVAVDGGMAHARRLAVVPQVWLGDFDSASQALRREYEQVQQLVFPTMKAETDLVLALDYVRDLWGSRAGVLSLVGALGAEFDHTLGNFWSLPRYQYPAVAWGVHNHVIYLPSGYCVQLQGEQGALVSVLALSSLSGVNYSGLQWALQEAEIVPFETFSLRNALAKPQAQVSWRLGDGLVVIDAKITPKISAL